MVTDAIGAEYYRKLGLEHIWDLGITVSLDALEYFPCPSGRQEKYSRWNSRPYPA